LQVLEEEDSDKELRILRVKGEGLIRAKSSREGLGEGEVLSFFVGSSRLLREGSEEGWREAKARLELDIEIL